MAYQLRAYSFQNLPDKVRDFVTETLYSRQVEACYQITSGLSNQNYLIVVEQSKYLLKQYQNDVPLPSLLFQRTISSTVCNVQKVIHWDEKSKVALFTYVDDVENDIEKHRLCDLVETIAQVHQQSSEHLQCTLDLKQALMSLGSLFKQRFYSQWEFSSNSLNVYPKELGCCHNDLVRENVISTKYGAVLIDFEYAAVGDIYFDLAGLVTSFQLGDEEVVWMLSIYYACIGSEVPSYAIEKLCVYRMSYLLLCIAWYEERGEVEKATSHTLQLKRLNATKALR